MQRYLKVTVLTNSFGLAFFFFFDTVFGLLRMSEAKDKFHSSQEENVNICVGVILYS